MRMFIRQSATIFLLELDSVRGILHHIFRIMFEVFFAFWLRDCVNHPLRCAQNREKHWSPSYFGSQPQSSSLLWITNVWIDFLVLQQLTHYQWFPLLTSHHEGSHSHVSLLIEVQRWKLKESLQLRKLIVVTNMVQQGWTLLKFLVDNNIGMIEKEFQDFQVPRITGICQSWAFVHSVHIHFVSSTFRDFLHHFNMTDFACNHQRRVISRSRIDIETWLCVCEWKKHDFDNVTESLLTGHKEGSLPLDCSC